MWWLDRLRGKPKEPLPSTREKKIQEIAARVHDEDYELQDLISDDALAEAAEARSEYGDDLAYPTAPIPTVEQVLDGKWVQKKVRAAKKLAKGEEQARITELKTRFPDSELDWSREYAEVRGVPGVVWTQDQKYFDRAGKEVLDPKM